VSAQAEMTLDVFEIVLTQIRQHPNWFPSDQADGDRAWITDSFKNSEVLRVYLDTHVSWYTNIFRRSEVRPCQGSWEVVIRGVKPTIVSKMTLPRITVDVSGGWRFVPPHTHGMQRSSLWRWPFARSINQFGRCIPACAGVFPTDLSRQDSIPCPEVQATNWRCDWSRLIPEE